jgi:hypothetical protein
MATWMSQMGGLVINQLPECSRQRQVQLKWQELNLVACLAQWW